MNTSPAIKGSLIFLMFILGINHIASSQDKSVGDSLLTKAETLLMQGDEESALRNYEKVLSSDAENFIALWHTALLYARIGFRKESEKQMLEFYNKSLEYAERTLQLYPGKGHSHFVYAVANGRISDLSNSQTRIEKSHVVKEHAEKAVELLPDYAPAWHLLGLWHSKVANVGSASQFAAGIISKGIPEGASNEKAADYIQKAIDMQPSQAIRYTLDLGKHYIRSGNEEKALQTLRSVLKMDTQNDIDRWNLEQGRNLLKELE